MKRLFSLVAALAFVPGVRADDVNFSRSGLKSPDPAYMISSEHAARLPRWSPEDHTPPPLELNQVLEMVRARLRAQLPDQDWRIWSPALRLPGTPWSLSIPYYDIGIQYHPKGAVGDEAMYWSKAKWWYFVVLMDGTVLTHDPKKD